MSKALISVNDLSMSIEENKTCCQILQNVSFTLNSNQLLGLVGHSGAGKSMTMNMLCGMVPEHTRVSGKVIFHGVQDIMKLNKKKRRHYCARNIAIILQDSINALNPYEKIKKQLEDSFLLHHPSQKDDQDVFVRQSLRDVGLEYDNTLLNKYPHQLSGGMRQRIAIAMALYSDARVLIADEPTTSLDTVNQKAFITFLKQMCYTKNLSMIYISHNLGLVQYLCEDVMVMNQGRIVERGTVREVFSNPVRAYTQQLVEATSRLLDIRSSKGDV
ncbi:ATP-binding cassette domain-containing protein [Paenibacillus sp. 1A_MP2]|uniref:ATP-binding cassette domain-containing protein n=1 Tax=Paenibacillus sp. 1A_MP2 TaxID=3457495 RepID=UPI003FCCCC67